MTRTPNFRGAGYSAGAGVLVNTRLVFFSVEEMAN